MRKLKFHWLAALCHGIGALAVVGAIILAISTASTQFNEYRGRDVEKEVEAKVDLAYAERMAEAKYYEQYRVHKADGKTDDQALQLALAAQKTAYDLNIEDQKRAARANLAAQVAGGNIAWLSAYFVSGGAFIFGLLMLTVGRLNDWFDRQIP